MKNPDVCGKMIDVLDWLEIKMKIKENDYEDFTIAESKI